MNDYNAILQSVLNDPDDNFPRLVLADWLEEHGNFNRAEMIRVQVEISETKRMYIKNKCFKRIEQLKFRARDLFDIDWTNPVADVAGYIHLIDGNLIIGERASFELDRGFVYHVTMNVSDFTINAKSIFSKQPITSVRLYDALSLANSGNNYFQGTTDIISETKHTHYEISKNCVAYGRRLAGLSVIH